MKLALSLKGVRRAGNVRFGVVDRHNTNLRVTLGLLDDESNATVLDVGSFLSELYVVAGSSVRILTKAHRRKRKKERPT